MAKPILKKISSIFEEEAPKKKIDAKKTVKVLESSIKSLKTARMSLVGIKSKLKEEDENSNEAVNALSDTIDSIESAISDIIDATSATNPAVQTLIGTVDTLEAEKDNAEIDAMLSGDADEFTEETEDEEDEEEETAEDEEEDEKKEESIFSKKKMLNEYFVVTYNGKPVSSFHPNANGTVASVFPIRKRDYMIFSSEKEAKEEIDYMKKTIKKEKHYIDGLKDKLLKYVDKLKIEEQ